MKRLIKTKDREILVTEAPDGKIITERNLYIRPGYTGRSWEADRVFLTYLELSRLMDLLKGEKR